MEAGSDPISVTVGSIYHFRNRMLAPKKPVVITFADDTYAPALIRFPIKVVPHKGKPDTELPSPVLVLMPGDTLVIKYNQERETFTFRGSHPAEVAFCRRLWQGTLGLGRAAPEQLGAVRILPAQPDSTRSPEYDYQPTIAFRRQPLDQYVRAWYPLKQQAETTIAALRHTAGIRPEVAAGLARYLRLWMFELLLRPVLPYSSRDSLRTITPAYRDTVAAEARLLTTLQPLPATATAGLAEAMVLHNQYQCIQQGHFPTVGIQYTHAKQTLIGFYRAWVCYLILDDARARHKDIRRWQHDYESWVKPYTEFARVLRGEPTVPLRSYKTTATTDSVVSAAGRTRHLTDVLATYQGRVVLLDLWASWCVPCREEIPLSAALATKYKSRGLEVVYLSVDNEAAEWRQALPKLPKAARNQYRFQNPSTTAFREQFEVRSVPRYMLIDRVGTIRYDDALRPGDPRFSAVLEKLLAQ